MFHETELKPVCLAGYLLDLLLFSCMCILFCLVIYLFWEFEHTCGYCSKAFLVPT